MKKVLFKGCATAIATPFTDTGINYDELEKFLEFQITNHIDAIVVCGTTGESATMSDSEKKDLISFTVKKIHNRIPVIAGTGSNCTKKAIELTKYAESVGVDGALIVTPYYNKTTQDGLIEHYTKIASSTSLPIIMYNVPSRTGVNILPETCFELSKIQNIVAIKEASSNISQVAQIKALCKDDLNIYSGNDDQIVPVLSLGGIGVISVLSNIEPLYAHNMVSCYFDGDVECSKRLQINALDLINTLFCEVNPIVVKSALNMYGFNFGVPRLPLVKLSDKNKEKLEKSISNFKDNITI